MKHIFDASKHFMVKYKDGGDIPSYDVRMSKEQLVKLMKTRGIKKFRELSEQLINDAGVMNYLDLFKKQYWLAEDKKLEKLKKENSTHPRDTRNVIILEQNKKFWESNNPYIFYKFFSRSNTMKNMPEPEFSRLAGIVLNAEVGLAKK